MIDKGMYVCNIIDDDIKSISVVPALFTK
jgi:hypothetical protein